MQRSMGMGKDGVRLLVAGLLASAAVLGGGGQAPLLADGSCGAPGCGEAAGAVSPFSAEGSACVEQTVTSYRQEYRQRVVPIVVNRLVSRVVEVPYTYTEMVPVSTPQRQVRTVFTTVARQVPYTYTELVPVTTPQQRTETFYTPVTRQVPYSYTELVPVTTPQQ